MTNLRTSSPITLESEDRSAVTVDSYITTLDSSKAKLANGRGRPKSKPDSKLASFNLPLDLIAMIDNEAKAVAAGNKSLFIIQLLESYFRNKQ